MNSEDKIRELEAKLAELTARFEQSERSRAVTQPSTDEQVTELEAQPTSSRRGLLKLAGAAAIGTVGATIVSSRPAAADNGLAVTNPALPTTFNFTGAVPGSNAFLFQAGTAFATSSAEYPAALAGWADNGSQKTGVYGYTNSPSGNGVVGYSHSDDSIAVYGKSLPTGAGTAGIGVSGEGPTGVKATGVATGANVSASAGTGIVATATGGDGIIALSAGGAAGSAAIRGIGGDFAIASNVSTKANMFLQPNNNFLFGSTPKTVPSARTDAHRVGELENVDGDLWWCVVAGTPGTWRKISGPNVAGAFHALTPGRVYDSRQTLPSPGPLTAGGNRTISVADRRDANLTTGAVVQADFVPAGATAVAANVTITGTFGAGFLTVNPGGNSTVGASTINWKADNQDIANGVILTLNANRELTIVAGGGGSTGFIIDVNGYYL